MAAILFTVAFLLLFLADIGSRKTAATLQQLLVFFVESLVLFSLFILLTTEVLSLFGAITYESIVILYSLFVLIFLTVNIVIWKENHNRSAWLTTIKLGMKKYGMLLLFLIAFSVIPLFLSFILYPPNNWDSMTYHLSRVEHWIQSGSLNYYPTDIDRQLFSQPFAEYIVLHLRLLAQNDFLSALGQYVAFYGTASLVFLISRLFLKSLFLSIISAVLALFVPMGVLQASSTQTDLIASFFLLAFVYFGLKSTRNAILDIRALFFCSISLGILFLTKYSAVLFCVPFVIWYSFSLLRKKAFKSVFLAIGMVAISVMLFNMPFLYRNFIAARSIFGSKDLVSETRNDGSLIEAAFSNSVRNFAIQLNTPIDVINGFNTKVTTRLLKLFGINANNSQNTWPGTFFAVYKNTGHEDSSGSLLAYLIAPFSCMALLVSRRKLGTGTRALVVCLISGFVLFSVVLKWQPWGARLMLPFSMLCCLVIGASFAQLPRRITLLAAGAFVLAGLPFVLLNASRPLVSVHLRPFVSVHSVPRPPYHRYEQYFVNKPGDYKDFEQVLSQGYAALEPHALLLSTGSDSWEYPLWVWFRLNSHKLPVIYTSSEFASFVPQNATGHEEERPDWFVSIGGKDPGAGWELFRETPTLKLFFPKSQRE